MLNSLSNLSQRNKNALIIGALFLLCFLTFQFLFLPVTSKRKDLTRILQTSKSNLNTMVSLQEEYNGSSRNIAGEKDLLLQRDKRFSLFSYLDTTAAECGVKKNIVYMKPSFENLNNSEYNKALVKARLEAISLKECIAFLNKIENSKKLVTINSFSISTTGKNNKMLDIIIETETIISIN